MRKFQEEKLTTNSRVYKSIYLYSLKKCHLCKPHSGCNSYGKYESRSWKDQSKKVKQWM
jgi:hypothetical protein